jgi:hypothetical protein
MKLCWFYRKAIAWAADDESPLPAWLEHHLRHCDHCARVRKTEFSLAAGLRRAAAQERRDVPPFLHARILRALDEVAEESCALGQDEKRLINRWWPVLIPFAAVLLLALYGAWKFSVIEPPTPIMAVQPDPEPTAAKELPTTPQLLAWADRIDQPLETELRSVVSDARSAWLALTDNFLPSRALQGGADGLEHPVP